MNLGLHHLHVRRRMPQMREPHLHPVAWKRYFDYVMYGVAVVAPFALLPQIIELFRTGDAAALSMPTFVLLALLNCLWLTYGLIHRATPVIISSFLFFLQYSIVAYGILLFG